MAALSTASMKYARPCIDRRSPLAIWVSRARRSSSLLGSVMWWCCVACVTPRWTVVSSRCRGSPFRMWGVGVLASVNTAGINRGNSAGDLRQLVVSILSYSCRFQIVIRRLTPCKCGR